MMGKATLWKVSLYQVQIQLRHLGEGDSIFPLLILIGSSSIYCQAEIAPVKQCMRKNEIKK